MSVANGRIVYRPIIKGDPPEGYDKDPRNRLRPPIKLGKVGDPEAAILNTYLKVVETLKDPWGHRVNTLFWIFEQYSKSSEFCQLSKNTQSGYIVHIRKFLDFDIYIGARKAKLGDIKVSQITLPMINGIKNRLIKDEQAAGKAGTAYVNGHIRAARAMMSWAINNIEGLEVHYNPLKGIKLNGEKPRDRYVTDEDYVTQYLFAVDHGAEYLPLVFEHAYLLACRSIEVCNLTLDDIEDEGYLVRRTKGSRTNVITWTPRLLAARDAAMLYREKVGTNTKYLIPSVWGNHITKNTLQSAMQSLKKLMHEAGLDSISWDLHDLKRKGISDAEDARIGGHKSEQMRERYTTKLRKFKPPR